MLLLNFFNVETSVIPLSHFAVILHHAKPMFFLCVHINV